jgi:Undecaprenyl-phosphate glucose phosphotransferase
MNFVEQPIRRDLSDHMSGHVYRGRLHAARKWPIQYDSVGLLAIMADIAMIVAISIICSLLHLQGLEPSNAIGKSLGSAIVVSALFIPLMKIRGMYRPTEFLDLRNQIRAVMLVWTSVFLLLAGAVFALKIGQELSRGASLLFAVFGVIALIFNRLIVRELLATGLAGRKFSGRNIVLITDHSQTDANLFHTLTGLGFSIDGYFTFPSHVDAHTRERLVAKVVEHIRCSDIKEIVVGADLNRWPELRALVAELKVQPFPISFIPLGTASEIFRRPTRELGNAIRVELQRGPLTSLEHAAKRTADVLFAGIALILLLPLFAIVAISIKLDSPGPVLFKQRRCGFNGKCFQIRKFRTMTVLEDGLSITQAQFADKRITRLGALLRRTSIDELPQLLNILDGSMSLVGPRPHAIAHDNEFDKMVRKYAFRRRVKPGLTGWAQVHGCRGPTPTAASIEQRVEYDLWYIDNWSLWLDLAIILWTPIEMMRGHNAY